MSPRRRLPLWGESGGCTGLLVVRRSPSGRDSLRSLLSLDPWRGSLGSLQVAAKALETGVFGAYFNVLINLRDITDEAFKDQVSRRQVWCPDPTWGLDSQPQGDCDCPRAAGGGACCLASQAETGTPGPCSPCVCQVHHRISSLLQEAKTQAALVLDCLETRQE